MTPRQLLTAAAFFIGIALGLIAEAGARAERQRRELEALERGVNLLGESILADLRKLQALAAEWAASDALRADLTPSEGPPGVIPHGDPAVEPSSPSTGDTSAPAPRDA